jgi:hypothetical protein
LAFSPQFYQYFLITARTTAARRRSDSGKIGLKFFKLIHSAQRLAKCAYAINNLDGSFRKLISLARKPKNINPFSNSVYFWISGMAAAWIAALVLRTFIVIPDKPAPVEYTYQRPEKNIEKKVDQRDTIYLISSEWLIPWNDFNFEHYCGGTNFPDMWNPAYGYGFPNGTMPWSSLVYLPPVDSAQSIPIQVNQDSLLVCKIDSSLQQLKSKKQTEEYMTVREFIALEIDERVEKLRKIKRVLRAARNRNKENDKDRLVVDWKGRRFNF